MPAIQKWQDEGSGERERGRWRKQEGEVNVCERSGGVIASLYA